MAQEDVPLALSFPIDRWGTVTGETFERICIVRSAPTSFLVLKEIEGQGYDDWFETAEDVADYLEGLQVRWDRPMPRRLVERAVNTLLKRAQLVGFVADPELLACVALEQRLSETPLGAVECQGVVVAVFTPQGMLVPSRDQIAWEMLGVPEETSDGAVLFFPGVGLRLSVEDADRKRLIPFFHHLNRWWKEGRDW